MSWEFEVGSRKYEVGGTKLEGDNGAYAIYGKEPKEQADVIKY